MKLAKVIALSEYKEERLMRGEQKAAAKSLPDAQRLWELMDKNISVAFWKKQI